MSVRLRGHVATLLNAREVAINIGASDQVEKGMLFDVLDREGVPIIDPAGSRETLGVIDVAKIRLRVTQVEDRYSIARTMSKRVNVGGRGIMSDMMDLYAPANWIAKNETLKKGDSEYESISEMESVVKRGDTVVQVLRGKTRVASDEEESEESVVQ